MRLATTDLCGLGLPISTGTGSKVERQSAQGWESVRRAEVDGGGLVPAAGARRVGLPDLVLPRRGGRGGAPSLLARGET